VLNHTVALSVDYTFALCYTDGDASTPSLATTDAAWRDSYIRLKISKVETLYKHALQIKTSGSIPYDSALTMYVAGTISTSSWVSLVDETLNGGLPCELSTVAAPINPI
jgi:hypothetical protein